ncbi:TetR/AcrR family transcriptional regulator [Streptomyces sp. NPDC046984]|uniref:TetR/AcrR family transcriptional regulator n=1 Tax=Streptomyces sp. NPDC046984 TaxID=3155138 RepID=UPI0034062867
MTRNATLRDHVAAAILDAAAVVLAQRGESVSMSEVAAAAGVGRTTLYRYFPSRETLLDALARRAFAELIGELADSGVDSVPVPEGVARVSRIAFGQAAKYQALMCVPGKPEISDEAVRQIMSPLTSLFSRGAADGTWRTDLSTGTLLAIYTALLEGALSQGLHTKLGAEPAAAAITSVFIRGTEVRRPADSGAATAPSAAPAPTRN